MTKWAIAAVLLVAVMLLPGCKGEPKATVAAKADVAGTVLLDGAPMAGENGEISFLVGGQGPVILPIKDGKFEGKGPVGESRVEIRFWKKGEPIMMDGKPFGEPQKENTIPAKFNLESKLTAKVAASGAKDLKFEVESK